MSITLYSCQIFLKFEVCRLILEKFLKVFKFNENPSGSMRNDRHADGLTDGRTDKHDEGNSRLCAVLRIRLIKDKS